MEKRFNILDFYDESIIVGNLDQEQVETFLNTYMDQGMFIIEEIHNTEESK